MHTTRTSLVRLILLIAVLTTAGLPTRAAAPDGYRKLKPDEVVMVDESNYILPTHGMIFFNPYNQQIYLTVPNGFVSYTLNGRMLPPYKTRNSQEPGGMDMPQRFNFYPDFLYVIDRLKVIKFNYDNELLHESRGWFGAHFVRKDGCFYYDNALNCMELRDADGRKIRDNPEIDFTPKFKTSMINYFTGHHVYFDGEFLWIDAMHHYQLMKADPETLQVLERFGEKPGIFKEPDDNRTNVYGMQFISQLEELCRGVCHIRFTKTYRNHILVYWIVESEDQGYVDVYDRHTLKKTHAFQLADFHYQNNRSVDFDPVSGRLFQEDNVDMDGREQTILNIYDLNPYLIGSENGKEGVR